MDPSLSSLPPEEVVRVAEFRAALRAFLRKSERNARKSGLTPQRYLLLLMIKGSPGGRERSTVTELSDRLQLAQSTVTELVRRAESVGLLEREPSAKDGRVAYLKLTPDDSHRGGALDGSRDGRSCGGRGRRGERQPRWSPGRPRVHLREPSPPR